MSIRNARPKSDHRNPLAAIIDPSTPLDAAEALLAVAVLFHMHRHFREARRALELASSALHLASLCGNTGPRPSLLMRAIREAEAQLDEAVCLSERRTA